MWNGYPRNTGKSPGDGFATYRLILSGVPAQTPTLSLYIPEMPTAYRLWANGGLVSENGTVGKNKHVLSVGVRKAKKIKGGAYRGYD